MGSIPDPSTCEKCLPTHSPGPRRRVGFVEQNGFRSGPSLMDWKEVEHVRLLGAIHRY